MTVIAVFNQKGGVGKTTIAANLAAAMAKNGIPPVVIDLDPQAHLTSLWQQRPLPQHSISSFYKGQTSLLELAVTLNDGLRFIPAHLELARVDAIPTRQQTNLRRLKQAIETELQDSPNRPVIIDCSPSLGILSFSAMFAADLILIPVAAEYLALNGAQILNRTLAGLAKLSGYKKRRYLINRYIPGRDSDENVVASLEQHFSSDILKTRIHEHDSLVEAIGWGTDVFSFDPDDGASLDFSFLLDELIEEDLLALPDWR